MKKLLIPILFLLFLSGCMVGPDFKKPEIEAPKKFVRTLDDTQTEVNLRWWELLDDPHLRHLINRGLEHNKDILIALSHIRESRAALGMTSADKWPRFDLNAGAGYGNYLGSLNPGGASEHIHVMATTSWELDFWGKTRRMEESARAQLLASEYGLRSMQIALIAEIAQTYFRLIDFRARLKIAQKTLALRDKALDIIKQKFKHGVIPEIDVNQAEIQKHIAEVTIPFYRRNIAKTEHALSVLTGSNPHKITEISNIMSQNIDIEIPVGLPSDLLKRRPDISQALMNLKARNAEIGAAVAMRFPTISLTGAFGFASNDLSNITSNNMAWGIGGSLLAPIFHFNENKLRVALAEEKTKQALLAYEKSVLNAFREVEDTLVDISELKEELSAREKLLAAAKNAEKLSGQRYFQGVTSFIEVIEAQRQFFDSSLSYIQTRQELLTAYVKLYKVLGGGWLSEKEEQEAQEHQQETEQR